MITKDKCQELAATKAKELFGTKYLNDNKGNACISISQQDNNFFLFVGLKTSKQCPHMKPNDIGWCVYAEIYVNMENGNVLVKDYQTET